jgi:Na+/melibiose symporter-like transporter
MNNVHKIVRFESINRQFRISDEMIAKVCKRKKQFLLLRTILPSYLIETCSRMLGTNIQIYYNQYTCNSLQMKSAPFLSAACCHRLFSLHVVCLKRAMASIRLFCSSAARLKVSNAAKVLDKIMHGGSKR